MPEETTIHQDQTVTITTTRAIIEGKTYPINNITSVEVATNQPSGILPMLFFIIGGFMVILNIFNPIENIAKILTGALLIGVGILIVKTSKPTYILKLATAAGEIQALQSTDQTYIQKINQSINQAIIHRG